MKLFLFRLYLYFVGVKFYKTNSVPKSPEYKTASFEMVDGKKVEFFFYREEGEDLIYKLGGVRREEFVGYVIQARFNEELPEILYKYNNLKFFFNINNVLRVSEEDISKVLLSIYMDFLESDMKG
jgi:hypothetical protein